MSQPIRTFSGAHPYRPQCVVTAATEVFKEFFEEHLHTAIPDLAVRVAENVTVDVAQGLCPRCHDPLHPAQKREGWKPAGTRALPCRCLPVCETCASWIEPCIGTTPVTAWPTTTETDLEGEGTRKEHELVLVDRLKAIAQTALLEVSEKGLTLVTEDGALPVQLRPHPGGWLEYGYDDNNDMRERQS